MQPFTKEVSLARAIQLAIEGRLVNVLSVGVGQPGPEREMIPVPFPLDKGLLGYRVALINRHSQDWLSMSTASRICARRLRVGQGIGWADVPIYEHEGIQVETTTDYHLLTPMLLHGRFDLYPRGLPEIAPEMADWGERYPDLAVEQHLLLHYPFFEASMRGRRKGGDMAPNGGSPRRAVARELPARRVDHRLKRPSFFHASQRVLTPVEQSSALQRLHDAHPDPASALRRVPARCLGPRVATRPDWQDQFG